MCVSYCIVVVEYAGTQFVLWAMFPILFTCIILILQLYNCYILRFCCDKLDFACYSYQGSINIALYLYVQYAQ